MKEVHQKLTLFGRRSLTILPYQIHIVIHSFALKYLLCHVRSKDMFHVPKLSHREVHNPLHFPFYLSQLYSEPQLNYIAEIKNILIFQWQFIASVVVGAKKGTSKKYGSKMSKMLLEIFHFS